MHNVILLRYKDQADLFAERFKDYANVFFSICDDVKDLVSG